MNIFGFTSHFTIEIIKIYFFLIYKEFSILITTKIMKLLVDLDIE